MILCPAQHSSDPYEGGWIALNGSNQIKIPNFECDAGGKLELSLRSCNSLCREPEHKGHLLGF